DELTLQIKDVKEQLASIILQINTIREKIDVPVESEDDSEVAAELLQKLDTFWDDMETLIQKLRELESMQLNEGGVAEKTISQTFLEDIEGEGVCMSTSGTCSRFHGVCK
ncbi:unnamed protein product, partial [Meganyctiphanes norvegica]